ncbi:MAG: ABC transporter ATP-binding protein [Acidimicrobiales bacterium]
MSAAIVTHQLTKRYGDVLAVDALDLEVHRGEVFGFLGPNGAGKSTTIRCLLDLARPTSGRAEILGFDSRTDAIDVHRNVGYLPGDLALYDKLTGGEVLEYLANLRGGVDPAKVVELAKRFDADLSRRCGTYSSGNRQKIGLIQAFMHEPPVVILDEPTTGLDPLVQQSLHELIESVRDEGRTVFLSSHTLSEVERVADRVAIIRHGALVVVSSISELKARAVRRLDFEFARPLDPELLRRVDGVREVTGGGLRWSVAYEGSVGAVLAVATSVGVVSLRSRDADLEEIFLDYYRDTPATGADHTRRDHEEEHADAAH